MCETEEHDEAYMIDLIRRLSDDESLQTYQQLQGELLKRISKDSVLKHGVAWETYQPKQDSVFDRVHEHRANGENMLNLYEEQFQKTHGIDHKTFTERWLLEQTGDEIQLEKVLEKPSFLDLVGIYDIQPMTAYVASKMIIDDSDFMGIFKLEDDDEVGVNRTSTYGGVAADALSKDELTALEEDTTARVLHHKETAAQVASEDPKLDSEGQSDIATSVPKHGCGCSDSQVAAHVLGEGQFLQFKLRWENVGQYLDSSVIAKRLKCLIPDEPKEPIYIFTASENGVVRFHPWGGIQRKLWHGYGDSETVAAFPKNIAHATTYGCFCFGVIYKEREDYMTSSGTLLKGGRTIIMRYNRWATDNAPIYAMVRQRSDERDISVPTQRNMLKHYRKLLKARVKNVFH